jgi:hypothetical protein
MHDVVICYKLATKMRPTEVAREECGESLPADYVAGQFAASSMMGFTPIGAGCPEDTFAVFPSRSL